MEAVKKGAIKVGAFGCTISGAVAMIDSEEKWKGIGQRMVEAFLEEKNLTFEICGNG
ncbi:hypothetical protein PTKIN_Ptkin14bG0132600 [Pterospermum kingtungense]